MRCLFLLLLAPVSAALGNSAFAHGTIPTCVSLGWRPSGQLFVGTNFGGLELRAEAGLEFTCELAVTGTQQALDIWVPLPSGRIAAVSTTSGATFGIYRSDEAGCLFGVFPGTEDLLVTDLVAVGETLYATGTESTARLVASSPSGLEVLHEAEAQQATGVRVDGDHVVAAFVDDSARIVHLVHREGDTKAVFDHPLEAGSTLRPLGFSGAQNRRVWFVERREDDDRVLSSTDFGKTLEVVASLTGRVAGFASKGDEVFLQSPQLGVLTLKGGTFEPISGSPHGSALAFDAAGDLYACGVPWQDRMAVGKSRDGVTFEAVVPIYDDLRGAVSCPDAPEVTTTCDEELAFIRGYYGFAPPSEEDVEGGPELAEVIEGVELAEPAVVGEELASRRDDGCGGAPSAGLFSLMAIGYRWRRRASSFWMGD